MEKYSIKEILEENSRRLAALEDCYDPVSGEGAWGRRQRVKHPDGSMVCVPVAMLADAAYRKDMPAHAFNALRQRHDFEYWCATCVTVKDKAGYADVRLHLNQAQRIIVAAMEEQRTAGKPIRIILLKARQLGGSTVVQAYMAWIQLLLRDNWHSLICAHVKDAAQTIRGMMSKLLAAYPEEYLPEGETTLRLTAYEGSRTTMRLGHRSNTVTITSAETQEAARGKDIAMAHLSEVAFWRTSAGHDPNNIIRSIAGSVALASHTLVVVESTANGVGNYFHNEWIRAEAGVSDKKAVFVPWYKLGIYRIAVDDYKALWNSLDDYEKRLWQKGLAMEQIAWYHAKRKEYTTHRAMQAEYPTTAVEAFTATDRSVFDVGGVARLRQLCREPMAEGEVSGDAVKGRDALRGVHFSADSGGRLKVWRMPDKEAVADRYLAVVDIGGRSDASDYSVVAVIDRRSECGKPEIVAQWRGHTDHDLLAWKAAQIAEFYGRALLVVESNTVETERTEGENSAYILEEIADYYPNMYYRIGADGCRSRLGFHTNRQTKPLVVNSLVAAVRDGTYVEHDGGAVDELQTYERKENGSFGAKDGCHDDILMTRCIGIFLTQEMARGQGFDITPLKKPDFF